MQTILPGKPRAELQAVSTVRWQDVRLVAYISGNSIVILGGPQELIQTIYLDQCPRLKAVVIDERSGKIATCSDRDVFIYSPFGKAEGVLKWSLELEFTIVEDAAHVQTLSWGSEEELLVGSTSLFLFSIAEQGRLLWKNSLPNAAKIALFSPDASLAASTGWQDRLVKLWRRQSFGSNDTRFESTYLSHPATVSAIYWRTPPVHNHKYREQNVDDVLFTVCVDGKVRIWSATDPHGFSYMQLWAEIDMYESLQPRKLSDNDVDRTRFAFFISNQDFSQAVAQAADVQKKDKNGDFHVFEHLAEIAATQPDICVLVDRYSNMSAWGLQNIGCKVRKGDEIFNVVHINDFNLSPIENQYHGSHHISFSAFADEKSPINFAVISHSFQGQMSWHETQADALFDPSPRSDRLRSKALWTGHEERVTRLIRDTAGETIVSCSASSDLLTWRRGMDQGKLLLALQSTISPTKTHQSVCLLSRGDFVLSLHTGSIQLWSTKTSTATLVAERGLETQTIFFSVFEIPYQHSRYERLYCAAITKGMTGTVWEVDLTSDPSQRSSNDGSQPSDITRFCDFKVENQESMCIICPIDTLHYSNASKGSVEDTRRDHVLTVSDAGTARTWRTEMRFEDRSLKWIATSKVRTNMRDPFFASVSSTRKIAVVDSSRRRLTIWDMMSSRVEHDESFQFVDIVQDLDWTVTPHNQAILAVGFSYKVQMFAQSRYNYLFDSAAWTIIREVHTKELSSHPIGDSIWLSRGNLAVAAGNQLYICNEEVSLTDKSADDLGLPVSRRANIDMLDLVSAINGPLPVYHPQFLGQCILLGDLSRLEMILLALRKILRYFVVGDDLDGHLGLPLEAFYSDESKAGSFDQDSSSQDGQPDQEFVQSALAALRETLIDIALPHVTRGEQLRLADGIECLALATKQKASMDDNAIRYYFMLSQHMLRRGRFKADIGISWREIVWAFHSVSQDNLIDHVSRQFRGRLLWENARECGMFMWINDIDALRSHFEVIARNEYTKSEEKNPVDCSLYYLALKKKNVLLGLWRMASWNREQAGTLRLLKNNFADKKWKTAASKNAYALLGKRRYEYAAAWFLLSGNLNDAVNVCVHQMEDIQLAVAIARVYDGDDSPVLRSLLNQIVLTQAAANGDRWQATWAFSLLGQRAMAIRALMEPLEDLICLESQAEDKARSYRNDDPALLVLYLQLREERLKSREAFDISPKAEWDFVMRTTRQYDRMGCDLLALNTVRNWKFVAPTAETTAKRPTAKPRRKSTRTRSSASASSVSTPKSPIKEKAKPTMFKEPDVSSLLDNFGF